MVIHSLELRMELFSLATARLVKDLYKQMVPRLDSTSNLVVVQL